MIRKFLIVAVSGIAGAAALTACSGGHTPTSMPPSNATSSSSVTVPGSPDDDIPKVQNPLPAKVLDGDPCQTALTSSQISSYLGDNTDAPKSGSNGFGLKCTYNNKITAAGFDVNYETKAGGGIDLAYRTVKNTGKRWVVLDPVQGYPAVGYVTEYLVPSQPKRTCVVVVGIRDELDYSVALVLGDQGGAQGKDACTIGRTIADGVMTNLKARA